MGLVINTNIAAMIAQRSLTSNTRNVTDSMERLATGYRINHAKDDVAGLSISELLRTQIRGNQMAIRNAQDGASLLQVAEGGLVSITEDIQRIRELTVQAANGTYSTSERAAIVSEVAQRVEDITNIAQSLKFNNIFLLNGSASQAVLQVGPNNATYDTLSISTALQDTLASTLGFVMTSITTGAGGAYESSGSASAYLSTIDTALNTVFVRRSTIGAYEQRLDSIISNLEITTENLSASESRIRDLDIAAETTKLTRSQVLQQSAASILAQANQIPMIALSLLNR